MKKLGITVAVFLGAAAMGAHAAEMQRVVAAVETDLPIMAMVSSGYEIDADEIAVDELLHIAGSEEESLRIAAVEVLGEMKTTRARAVLGVILYSNGLATVRAKAADQLGNLGDSESLFALALALEWEKNEEVRAVISANIDRNLLTEPTPESQPGAPVAMLSNAG